jgi:phosphoserine aminotransferase
MNERIFNFSAGPAAMPLPVLEKAQSELLSAKGSGMSVMEISHRSELFGRILADAERGLRRLLGIPNDHSVIFMQGGATLQFSVIPMNFLAAGEKAAFIVTGHWGEKAAAEAERFGIADIIYDSKDSGYDTIPKDGEIKIPRDARYVHYTSNETIDGVEFNYDLDGGGVPVVCDASSNILSKPIDIEKYDIIYAGSQKNIGPSGVTVVIVRNELLEIDPGRALPGILDLRRLAKESSMVNTPNTWGIYMIGLVCDWLIGQGGLDVMETRNAAKAQILYDAIDGSDGFYVGHTERDARSKMNVTFRLASEELADTFCREAELVGLSGLRGHRTVGGIRASIYNAMPKEGVERLVEFMRDFRTK